MFKIKTIDAKKMFHTRSNLLHEPNFSTKDFALFLRTLCTYYHRRIYRRQPENTIKAKTNKQTNKQKTCLKPAIRLLNNNVYKIYLAGA